MNISQHATELNVTETDVISLARNVISYLIQDKVDIYFMTASEAEQIEMIQAYVKHAVTKMAEMQTHYLTNNEFKELLTDFVFNSLKPEAK